MAMRTLYVTGVEGRVCFSTCEETRRFVTVEVPSQRTAYRFRDPMPEPLKVGDWVRFSGYARVEIVSRKAEPERLRRREYYHAPHDGTSKSDWEYHDFEDVHMCEVVGPPRITALLRLASARADEHVQDWSGTISPERLRETARHLATASSELLSLVAVLEAEREAASVRAAVVDIGDVGVQADA